MAKYPKKIDEKMKAYSEKHGELIEARQKVNEKIKELESDILKIKTELKASVEKSIEEISEDEKKLRQQLTEKEMSLTAYRDRLRHLPQVDNTRSLAVEAVRAAREYAEEQYRKESPKKLEAIESAKIAYLQSVADFASFKNELASLPFEIARETVPTALDSVGPPSIPEIAWTYRQHVDSDGNKYMIFTDEVNHAVKEFEVKRFSRV